MKRYLLFLALIIILVYGCQSAQAPVVKQETNQQTVIATSDQTAQSTQSDLVEVNIKGFKFNPEVITIKKGTTVRWIQMDDVQHTVTADDGTFDSPLLSAKGTFEFKFDKVATYDYHCRPHPSMRAKVIVTE